MLCFNRLLTKLRVSIKLRITKVIPWEEVTVAPSKSVSHTVCCWDTLRGKYALENNVKWFFVLVFVTQLHENPYSLLNNILMFWQTFSTLLAVVTLRSNKGNTNGRWTKKLTSHYTVFQAFLQLSHLFAQKCKSGKLRWTWKDRYCVIYGLAIHTPKKIKFVHLCEEGREKNLQ